MSSIKEYMFEIQQDRADKWIRENLENPSADEESEDYKEIEEKYWDWQAHLADQAEFEAELEWLRKTDTSIHYEIFVEQLHTLKKVVTEVGPELKSIILKMSFAYGVTLLETYLGDIAKALIGTSDTFFRNAITQVDELKKAKYSIESLAEGPIDPKGLAIKELSTILFHNIYKSKRIIEGILGTNIQINIDHLLNIVDKRHDIVHRNGHTKEGNPILVTNEDFTQMIEELERFVNSLQQQINKEKNK
jgi:hypothetical protein